jgi:hypothetical protein
MTSQKDNLIGGAILLASLYFFVVRPLSKAFGKSNTELQNEQTLLKIESYFNPNFWRTGGQILTDSASFALTGKIENAIGILYDDEAEIVSAFRVLKYKNQVSYLSFKYAQRFGRDLLTDLQKNLDAEELKPIYDHINKLPLGK